MKTRTNLVAIGLMALVSTAQAANPPASLMMIPPQINYQGRLTTAANVPYNDATHSIDLSLYPTASGGTRMWAERYTVLTRDGYFSVNLGSGGTGLLATNLPIWQVLWKTDGASPDNFFMALTVRTDPSGNAVPSPAEATPRQQFLTAPFAYRAHQSVYATKADGLFSAPQGVQTPSLSSTTNEIGVTGPLRVSGAGGTVYANAVQAHGTSPGLKLLNANGPVALGINYLGGISVAPTHASSMYIGSQANAAGPGTDILMDGRTIHIATPNFSIGTPNFTLNRRPIFVNRTGSATGSTRTFTVQSGIDTTSYNVVLAGWTCSTTSPAIQAVFINPFAPASASVSFAITPASSVTVTVFFLGIAKELF